MPAFMFEKIPSTPQPTPAPIETKAHAPQKKTRGVIADIIDRYAAKRLARASRKLQKSSPPQS